ncbi:MAG: hypothetical protein MR389_01975 [Clostridiales bacterium]|nr:hypothetical protein [Clostridiales bacterium]
MSAKQKKKRKVRNRTKDVLFDYVKTNNEYTDENRRRQEEEGLRSQGLKNLNATEKTCIAVIVLGLIGIVLKYFVFG